MDEVHLHCGVDAGQGVLTRGVEMELLQLIPDLVEPKPVTTFSVDLNGMAVVDDFELL